MEFWDKFVDVLQVASILSAALFAALALFTEYKKDGKTTRTGRFAVVGIVLSALCSLGMQWGQEELDRLKSARAESKAKTDAANELGRFRQQMNRLGGMSALQEQTLGRSEDLATQMQASLLHQLRLQQQVQGTVLEVQASRNQEQTNTAKVLRTMWDDANRIGASSLQLVVRYSCGPIFGQTSFPRLMASDVTAQVYVAPRRKAGRRLLPDRRFASGATLQHLQPDAYVEFESRDQRVATSRQKSVDGDQVEQFSYFQSFTSDDLNGFNRPERWRDALFEVVLTGRTETGFGEAAKAVQDTGRELKTRADHLEVLREAYEVTEPWISNEDFHVSVLDCPIKTTLLVNGRIVGEAEGLLARVSQGDEDVDTLTVIKFPIVPTIQTAFPAFEGLSVGRLSGSLFDRTLRKTMVD